MNTFSLIQSINNTIREHLDTEATKVDATALHLDIRAGSTFWIDDACICVTDANDRTLQYYGGFEYVNKSCREQVGDYVFYFIDYEEDDCRVRECLDYYKQNEKETV